jgi:predicted GNAT family acetyltransferase
MDVTITDNRERNRYEAKTPDGDVAGVVGYQKSSELIVFTHTNVEDKYEGQGIGSKLAAGALNDARAQNLPVLPLCPFIKGYIERHPEYADLVFTTTSHVTD